MYALFEKALRVDWRQSLVRKAAQENTTDRIAQRRYDRTMRLRNALAALLVVLVMSASSWAAACDTACMLRGAVPGCHAAEGSSTKVHGSVPTAHSHCMHMRASSSSRTSPVFLTSTESDCTHTFCRQPASFLLSAKELPLGDLQWAALSSATNSDQVFVPSRFSGQAPPSDILRSNPSISVALRI
jgi:hypothetical protein